MKIAFFNVTAGHKEGGLETYAWEVGHALTKRGHDVTVICGEPGQARYDDVKLITVPFRTRDTFFDFGNRYRKFRERLSFGLNAYPHLLSAAYDVVVVNKPYDFVSMMRAKTKGFQGKVVFRSGGTDFFICDKFYSPAVDVWVASSHYNAKQVEARYGTHCNTIHNGVNTERFGHQPASMREEQRSALDIPEDVFTLMSVGRLVGWKGIQTIINVLPDLPAVHFIVVGEGDYRSTLEELANEKGVSDRVRFMGRQDHEALSKLHTAADVLVQPSIGEEIFGITIVEAMASGLPVLGARNGGIVEIIQEGKNGYLIDPTDNHAWTQRIQALTQDTNTLRSLGEAAKERATSEFSWAKNAATLESLVSTLN